MSFVQPGWLLLGLLGVLVILLHIRRRTVVEVSSVELWRRFATTTKSRTAWRPPRLTVLLLLQLLAVALLVLTLARPQLGLEEPPADHWIIMMDTSGSMSAADGEESRFEHALTWLRRELLQFSTEAGNSDRVSSLVAVGPSVDVVSARLGNIEEVEQALSRLKPSSGGASWEDAAKALSSLVAGDESIHLTLLTDGAGAEAARAAVVAQFPGAELEVMSFGAGVENAGLSEVQVAPTDLEAGNWHVEGEVRVFAAEPQPVELIVMFTPEGTEGALPWTKLALNPSEGHAAFALDLALPGAGLLELRLPNDALPYDNQVQFQLRAAPRTVRVLHIGPDNPPLQRALEAIDGVELFRADALPEESEEFDLVHPGPDTPIVQTTSTLPW